MNMESDGGKQASQRKRGLSAWRLKLIASIFLFFQVISTSWVPFLMGTDLSDFTTLTTVVVLETVSWCAIPIYAWLLVEGYKHSRSLPNYALRLLLLALICEVPYDLNTFNKPFEWSSQNPVFALLLALIVLILVDYARRCSPVVQWLGAVFFSTTGMLWALFLRIGMRQGIMNIGVLMIGFALIFYLLELKENTMMMSAGLLGALCLVTPAVGVAFLHYRNESLGIPRKQMRVFYAVYPVMLLAAMLI